MDGFESVDSEILKNRTTTVTTAWKANRAKILALRSTIVRALIAAGATPEMLLAAIEADEKAPAGGRGCCFVYKLIDPRDNVIFYVGITARPKIRFQSHRNDRLSAAWPRIREIQNCGHECRMEIISEFSDRNSALEHEHKLISSLPELLNKDRHRRRMAPA